MTVLVPVLLTVVFTGLNAQEQVSTRILDDGTTVTRTYDPIGTIRTETIVLPSGRYTTSFFRDDGTPRYGVVDTGTGSFGLMYYDQADEPPLFKFWDHGDNDRVIRFYSRDKTSLRQIAEIRLPEIDGERRVIGDESFRGGRSAAPLIVSFLAGIIGCFAFTNIRTHRATRSKISRHTV